jgi:hypothetical protein
LSGCEYVGIWPFSRNAFSDESFKAAYVYVVGVMNALFQEYGLTTRSMAQVGSSLEKKVTAEKVRPYPRAAPSVGRSGRRLKGKISNSDTET